jgi:uncharacterized protein YpuA (DUF1002 family)
MTETLVTLKWLEMLLNIPEYTDYPNDDLYTVVYNEAKKQNKDEEESEKIAQEAETSYAEECYTKHNNAIQRVAEHYFSLIKLNLDFRSDGYVLIYEETTWEDSAKKILELINGYGQFYFSSLEDFLESGPFTVKEAVLEHLSYLKFYGKIYGDASPEQMFERYYR